MKLTALVVAAAAAMMFAPSAHAREHYYHHSHHAARHVYARSHYRIYAKSHSGRATHSAGDWTSGELAQFESVIVPRPRTSGCLVRVGNAAPRRRRPGTVV